MLDLSVYFGTIALSARGKIMQSNSTRLQGVIPLLLLTVAGCSESPAGKKTNKPIVLPGTLRAEAYQNKEPKFSIHFPRAFEKIEWDENGVLVLVREGSGKVNMHVRCPKLPRANIKLEELTGGEMKGLQEGTKGVQILGSGKLEGAEHEIAWAHLSAPRGEDGLLLHTIVFTALHPPYSVLLFATGTKDKFDEYRQVFDDCARSLRLE